MEALAALVKDVTALGIWSLMLVLSGFHFHTDGFRACTVQHTIEHAAANGVFGLLIGKFT